MQLIPHIITPRTGAVIAATGTGVIFGLDFSDPQTVQTLLGGGLAFVALMVAWRIVVAFIGGQSTGDKNLEKLLDTVNGVLSDIKNAVERQNEVIKNNTQAMTALQDLLELKHNQVVGRLETLEKKVDCLPTATPAETSIDKLPDTFN